MHAGEKKTKTSIEKSASDYASDTALRMRGNTLARTMRVLPCIHSTIGPPRRCPTGHSTVSFGCGGDGRDTIRNVFRSFEFSTVHPGDLAVNLEAFTVEYS